MLVEKPTTETKILEINNTTTTLNEFKVSVPSFLKNSDNQKWLIIGGSSIIFVIIFLSLAIIYWLKRKRKRLKSYQNTDDVLTSVMIGNGINEEKQYSTSTESSVDCIELPKEKYRRNLRHSLSFDVCAPYLIRKHSVQPVSTLPRWNSLTSPRTSISTIKSEQNNSSDSDDASIDYTNTGRLWFSLSYDDKKCILQVTLIRAKYLPARGLSKGVRDPFVKIFLMPDEENHQQSKVRKRTLSPKFNEIFHFKVQKSDLPKRTLKFSVYDMDKKRIRHCLGHVEISLNKMNVYTNSVMCKELGQALQGQALGELEVSLACNPFNNRLKVSITKTKGIDISAFEDPHVIYIKAELYHGQKLLRHKTITARNYLDSSKSELIFHETMSFGIPAKFYDSCYITLMLVVSGRSTKEKILGKINLGPFLYARGENLLHWQEMISNPRTTVTRWHKLESAL